MLSYTLHCEGDFWTAFTLPSLVDKLKGDIARMHAIKPSGDRGFEEYRLRHINKRNELIELLTVRRPQGFLPGYQYGFNSFLNVTLCTARSSEMETCCQERVCEHNMVLGITCATHGDHNFSVRCLRCDPDKPEAQDASRRQDH